MDKGIKKNGTASNNLGRPGKAWKLSIGKRIKGYFIAPIRRLPTKTEILASELERLAAFKQTSNFSFN